MKRELFPTPAEAAWRKACRTAARTPRFEPGRIALGRYSLRYPDLLTLCPQWHDIFVLRSLAFRSSRSDPRILDCGANIGLASLFYKHEYPAARITAFEADPAIAGMLSDNVRANGAADVDVVQAAVWTTNGRLSFRPDGADGGAVAMHGRRTRGAVEVPAVRLKDALTQERIDLLKLDVEGAETVVLADCAAELGRVAAMLVEVHEFDPARRRMPDICRLLDSSGFTYAITHITPVPDGVERASDPFPHRSPRFVAAVAAWRNRAA